MRLYKRKDVYYLDYTDTQGKRRQVSTGTKNRKLAEEIASKKHTGIIEGKFDIQKPEKLTFEEFSGMFLEFCKASKKMNTARFHNLNVETLKKYFKNSFLHEITAFMIENYRIDRLKQVSASTVNREMATLNHIYNLAIQWGKLNKNPVKTISKLKEPPGRIRYLSVPEIKILLDECRAFDTSNEEERAKRTDKAKHKSKKGNPIITSPPSHLYVIVLLALNTGMRKGEILALKTEDVDMENRIISVKDSKSGKRRDIHINDSLHPVLDGWIKGLENGRVFGMGDIKHSFHSALERAEITDFHFHDLRHTFASHLVMEGIDLATVKELMGHATIQMTMRYAHLSPDHRKKAVDKIGIKFNFQEE